MDRTLNGLLASRKFWLAVFGVVTAIVAEYAQVPDEIWISIEALIITVIGSIAIEDHGRNSAAPSITVTKEELEFTLGDAVLDELKNSIQQ